MQKLSTITPPFLEILLIRYFLKLLACLGTPDHTQQKLTSMNVQLHAKNHCNNLNLPENTGNVLFWLLWASLGMPDHIQQKLHDQHVASMNLSLHQKNHFENSNLAEDIGDLWFQGAFSKIRYAWTHTTNITWLQPYCSFHEYLSTWKKALFLCYSVIFYSLLC